MATVFEGLSVSEVPDEELPKCPRCSRALFNPEHGPVDFIDRPEFRAAVHRECSAASKV
jgi:hypothetical protein